MCAMRSRRRSRRSPDARRRRGITMKIAAGAFEQPQGDEVQLVIVSADLLIFDIAMPAPGDPASAAAETNAIPEWMLSDADAALDATSTAVHVEAHHAAETAAQVQIVAAIGSHGLFHHAVEATVVIETHVAHHHAAADL